MILTNCAACAAPLAHDAPRCVRCHTRYCNKTCQHDHWRRGHKQICKKVHRGGNAEQYHADKKYKEAVAEAVEACAADTKRQTCYICTQVLHWKTKEGLVRGCSCRGTAGFAHVSCLAEQAKILVAEVEANNLGVNVLNERFKRWWKCSLCDQEYHGIVACALGWACWKTYLARPEISQIRTSAMTQLGNGLEEVNMHEERIAIIETQLSTMLRLYPQNEPGMLNMKHNLARCYLKTGRLEEAARLFRLIYARNKVLVGATHYSTKLAAHQLACTLIELGRYDQVKSLVLPLLRQFKASSKNHRKFKIAYATALYRTVGASRAEVFEAVEILEKEVCTDRRVLGPSHPDTLDTLAELDRARMTLEDI